MGETAKWITKKILGKLRSLSETKLSISKKDGTLLTSSRHMSIMSNASKQQTLERKKVMKTIKNYSEVLALATLWAYAMAVLVIALDIFVWRA